MHLLPRLPRLVATAALMASLVPAAALAQDGGTPEPTATPSPPERPGSEPRSVTPASLDSARTVELNFVEADLLGMVEFFAKSTKRNFILGDTRELEGKKITIISHSPVSPQTAYEAFLSALEVHGFAVVKVGGLHKVIKAEEAQQSPGPINDDGTVAATDNYVTQVFTLENVAVTDVREIIDNLVSPNAKVLAYAPTNSLILTDSGHNLRRIFKLVSELDIAAPKSTMQIYPIVYADAMELKGLIEELYPPAEDTEQDTSSRRTRRSRRRRSSRTTSAEAGEGVTAGKAAQYISKVLAEERTNSLILLADENGHEAVQDLIAKIDIDVDPTRRSQIYVYRLEHAKAEDITQVLQELSQEQQGGRGNQSQGNERGTAAARVAAARARAADDGGDSGRSDGPSGAIAAFESGMRIAADENTNSLVVIASKDDYAVVKSIIEELDVKRKQVFVDCVIMELSSIDGFDFNIAYHAPFSPGNDSQAVIGGQLGANSLGFSPDLLSGFAMGVFGQTVDVPITDPTTGTSSTLAIPAFGVALQALKTNQMVNIVSSPSLVTLDNEEATISVGRKIPFPVQSGLNGLGQPVRTFQREDVDITLEVTPRINSENYVTLELKVSVQEIEENDSIDVNQAGFITSNREVETVALVRDNQTMVLGGLVGSTDTESETKIPILGDLPIIGALFRNRSKSTRRTNLMVFLTPHIIDDEADMDEIVQVKEAQRREFMRRFYGKSQDEQLAEIMRLLQYSMNQVDRPSVYRGPAAVSSTVTLDGEPISAESREQLRQMSESVRPAGPGSEAGRLPRHSVEIDLTVDPEPAMADELVPVETDAVGSDAVPVRNETPADGADDDGTDDDGSGATDEADDTDGEGASDEANADDSTDEAASDESTSDDDEPEVRVEVP